MAKTYKAATDVLIIALFGGLIFIPFLLALTESDKNYSETEKRFLADFPHLSLRQGTIIDFARGFDAYYQDHFGMRELLIYRYYREMSKRFHVAGAPQVVVGKDGWFFYSGEEVLDDLMGRSRLTSSQLEQLSEKVRNTRRWLKQQGIYYLLAVAPNKQSIYPELLPDFYLREKKETRLDQVVGVLNDDTETRLVDLRSALLAYKKKKRIYDKTDTHWNSLGAYVAYRELMKDIEEHFPEYDFADYFSIGVTWRKEPAGDLARLSGREHESLEMRPVISFRIRAKERDLSDQMQKILPLKNLQPLYTEREKRPFRVLVLHDSFLNPMKPFLSESFGQVLYIWKYYDREIETYFNRDALQRAIDEFHPDIVIDMIVERHLDWLIRSDTPAGSE